MRTGWIIFLFACTAPEVAPWAPEDPWTWQDVSQPEVVSDSFQQPMGLAFAEGQIWVADAGSGTVTGLSATGSTELEWDTGFSPTYVTVGAGWLVASSTEEDGLIAAYDLTNEAVQVLGSGRSWGTVTFSMGRFWWHAASSATLYSWVPGESEPTSSELSGAILALTATPDGVYVVTGTNKPWNIRSQDDVSIAEIWEEPQDLVWASGTLWISTRSARWPYPGWIYRLDDDSAKVVEYSPPEPGPITATSSHVYWGSKQTLTRAALDGKAYQSIALQTSVADVIAEGDTIFWTDRQRGLVLTWED